jgi:DNA-binding response OmpR family regulator
MNILIADNDRASAQALSLHLNREGHRTAVAFDTPHAISVCQRNVPDVVILDLQTPDDDGQEAVQRLKASARTANVPVIVLTARAENEHAALEKGAAAFLLKPPDFGRIDAALIRCSHTNATGTLDPLEQYARTALVPGSAQAQAESAAQIARAMYAVLRNILVVDDDRVLANLVGRRLQRAGFASLYAGDVPDALRMLTASRVDAVILDLALPSGDGLDVIQRLRSSSRTGDLPVFVVSGSTDAHGAEFVLAAGADRFFTKPPDLDELIGALRERFPLSVAAKPEALNAVAHRLLAERR